jgi:predicted nucleic acid-binding protein
MPTFFTDTYAIIELLKGSPAYRPYKDSVLVTTEFNLAEFAYAVTRDYPDEAEEICSRVRQGMRLYHPGDRDYLRAAHLRRDSARQQKKFSLIDCVGYSVAESLSLPFLTGDQEFEGMAGVEYVK